MILHQVFFWLRHKSNNNQDIYSASNLAKNFAKALRTGTECSIFSCSNPPRDKNYYVLKLCLSGKVGER